MIDITDWNVFSVHRFYQKFLKPTVSEAVFVECGLGNIDSDQVCFSKKSENKESKVFAFLLCLKICPAQYSG